LRTLWGWRDKGISGRPSIASVRTCDPAHLIRGFSQMPRTHSFAQAGAYLRVPKILTTFFPEILAKSR